MDTSIARRSDDKLIRAAQGIDKSLPFHCPGCKQEVYAATEGKVQIPHFRHKSIDGSKGCTESESYIHWITKELFADFFKKVESLYVEIPFQLLCSASQTCKKRATHSFDLKANFPKILVEEHDQGFKPDCMLHNEDGEVLYIEVKYTHGVSEEKIALGVPIIELCVSNEKDIDNIIANGKITPDVIQYNIYNKTALLPTELTFDCGNKCLRQQNNRHYNRIDRESNFATSGNPKERSYWRSIYQGFAKGAYAIQDKQKSKSISATIDKLNQDLKKDKDDSREDTRKDSPSKQMTFDFDT